MLRSMERKEEEERAKKEYFRVLEEEKNVIKEKNGIKRQTVEELIKIMCSKKEKKKERSRSS